MESPIKSFVFGALFLAIVVVCKRLGISEFLFSFFFLAIGFYLIGCGLHLTIKKIKHCYYCPKCGIYHDRASVSIIEPEDENAIATWRCPACQRSYALAPKPAGTDLANSDEDLQVPKTKE